MNKTELIDVTALKSGLSRTDAAKAVNAMLETVTERLQAGEAVQILGFGSFVLPAVSRCSRLRGAAASSVRI